MPDQIVLSWDVDVSGSSFGPAEAATALAAVPLYNETESDQVLGQLFGLTVASDVTTDDGVATATRTLTLNMNNANPPEAPPIFPCRQRLGPGEELEPPYAFREAVTLAGSFFVETGISVVPTTASQIPALSIGTLVQFLLQQGVFYEVAAVGATSTTLTFAYTGVSGNTTAFKEVAAPVELDRLAIFSTSEHDTNGVATTPAIAAGSGARSVEIQYMDSTGAGPFEAEADLTGRRPAGFTYDMPEGIDVAEIVSVIVSGYGAFENSVGQLTLVELSDALPAIPLGTLPGTGVGSIEGTSAAIGITNTFTGLTDEAQGLIARHLVYLPPSYFALAAQGAATPALAGDFLVTTGSTNVVTTEDQTAALVAGNTIRFAHEPLRVYTIAAVTDKIVTLTETYSGFDIGSQPNSLMPVGGQPTDVKGTEVINKATAAMRVSPSPATVPTNTQLSGPLAQFVAPDVAMPPPSPPLSPATITTPTFLSDYFTQTLQLALKGVAISPVAISFI